VGPRWGEGNEEKKLKNATLNALRRAEEKGLKSIAFPALSTGIFGFPLELAARIMLQTVEEYLNSETGIQTVVFTLFDDPAFSVFQKNLENIP